MKMKMLKTTAVLLTVSTTSACSLFRTPVPPEPIVKIVEKTVEREINQPVMPKAIDLKEPMWYVVSEKNLDEFLAENRKKEGAVVFFAMTPADYELMAYNLQEIKRYVREMKEVVVYYRKVTIPEKKVENTINK